MKKIREAHFPQKLYNLHTSDGNLSAIVVVGKDVEHYYYQPEMLLIDENLELVAHYNFEKPAEVKEEEEAKALWDLDPEVEEEESATEQANDEPIENEQDYSPYINLYDAYLYFWNGGRILGALFDDHLNVYKIGGEKQELIKVITLRGT